MLKIWGRASSSNTQKVLWCCHELGVEYERIDTGGSFGGLDTPEYRVLNPNRRIPTIDDDGFVLWEANTIVRYLCRKFGFGTLYPAEAAALASVERWMDWQLCHVLPANSPIFHGLIRTAPEARDHQAIEAARQQAGATWQILDDHLARQPFVGGAALTAADIPLGVYAYRWFALPIERPKLANLERWYERLSSREAFRSHVMLPLV